MTDHKYRVFRFRDVEVREREFLLIKVGEELPVEPKAFRVLLYLLRNPNRLVTKEEILNSVWHETAVSDNSLTRSIATLRRLLGDDSREPRYILTVPTVGYRFVCAVEALEEDQGEQAAPAILPAPAADDMARVGMRVPVAVACMAVLVLGIAANCFIRQQIDVVNQIPMENSSEVLAEKARQIAESFGYTDRPRDAIFGWEYNTDYLIFASRQKGYSVRHAGFIKQHPPPVIFWYRESPMLLPTFYGAYAPPRLDRGTSQAGLMVVLDSEGRLIEFRAQPSPGSPVLQQTATWEWSRLFAAAGLDPARFTPVQPAVTPASLLDTEAAWAGSWDSNPHDPLRVEAAVYRGRPTYFRITGPWTHTDQHPGWSPGWFTFNSFLLYVVALPLAAGLFTWRSIRLGKGDWRGAFHVAGWAFGLMFVGGIVGTPHVIAYTEITIVFDAFRDALVVGTILSVLYMGAESQMRTRSPRELDSWDRILAGKLRVPAVGGEILIGLVIGVLTLLALYLIPIPFIEPIAPRLLPNTGAYVSLWCWEIVVSVGGASSYAFALSVLVQLVRRRWLAVSIFVTGFTLALAWGHTEGTLLVAMRPAFILLVLASLFLRFGLLSVVAFLYSLQVFPSFPITADASTWYARTALLAMASLLVPAVYAFYVTVAGQALWPKRLQDL